MTLIERLEPEFLGYFDDANQTVPSYDPGLNVLCPVCLRDLCDPIKTISLMRWGDKRSYFFRIHKHCEGPEADKIEWSIIDAAKEARDG